MNQILSFIIQKKKQPNSLQNVFISRRNYKKYGNFDISIFSVTVDGGGASSGSLLYTAVQYLEEGKCDYAVVGATNLIFKPGVQLGKI